MTFIENRLITQLSIVTPLQSYGVHKLGPVLSRTGVSTNTLSIVRTKSTGTYTATAKHASLSLTYFR